MGVQERKEREKIMRREHIQSAAKKVFLEKGFHSATMEGIAEQSELGIGTLYQYFKSKDELYASLNLISLGFLEKEIENICNKKDLSPEDKLLGLKEALLSTYRSDPLILRNILHIQVGGALDVLSSELLFQIQELTHKCVKGMASIFEEGIRKGRFLPEHSMALTDFIWGAFTGIVVYENSKTLLNPNKDYLESTVDLAFKILCRGIKKESQSG
jgi:AcrR family transcriptional regulator